MPTPMEEMKKVLVEWWDRKIGDEEFYMNMCELIIRQGEKERQNYLAVAEINAKIETLIQRIRDGKADNGTQPPLPH